MANEAIAAAAVVVAPLFETINFGGELTPVGAIQKINECVANNKQILLIMDFHDRFDATGAMQNTIVENSRRIKGIAIHNYCKEKGEHRKCFNFFTKLVLGIIGNGKHLMYNSYEFEFELEQANQLAQALLRSNNNNNGAIESFHFDVYKVTTVILQPVLDALLATGVRKITFGNEYNSLIDNNNINIDFTRMETNESLKELDLGTYKMREEDFRNLFNSIKKNQGLEKLELNYNTYKELPEEVKRLFEKMMCENSTLVDCRFYQGGDNQDPIFEVIQFHMEQNRMWKRYIMKRNEESTVAAQAARARAGAVIVAPTVEANNKKILKMRLLLHLFMRKPLFRDTILFHLLSEYPDDLIDTDHFRNRY